MLERGKSKVLEFKLKTDGGFLSLDLKNPGFWINQHGFVIEPDTDIAVAARKAVLNAITENSDVEQQEGFNCELLVDGIAIRPDINNPGFWYSREGLIFEPGNPIATTARSMIESAITAKPVVNRVRPDMGDRL